MSSVTLPTGMRSRRSPSATTYSLIDDSCEAIGATYRGRSVGSFGRAGAFAFYPNKQMTTGEGGMVVTDDAELAEICRSLRNQGRGRMGTWLEHERLGYNYRLDELSAALGVSQIERLDSFLAKRRRVASWYTERLAEHRLGPPTGCSRRRRDELVRVRGDARPRHRPRCRDGAARGRGHPSRAYFPPLHLQPYIRERFGTREGMLPVTEDVARRTLALPFHNNLTEEQVARVVDAVTRAVAPR